MKYTSVETVKIKDKNFSDRPVRNLNLKRVITFRNAMWMHGALNAPEITYELTIRWTRRVRVKQFFSSKLKLSKKIKTSHISISITIPTRDISPETILSKTNRVIIATVNNMIV